MAVKTVTNIGDDTRRYREESRGTRDYGVKAETPPVRTEKADFRHIGQDTQRIDGWRIVTGRARYTQDIKLRKMLVGKILRAPHAAAEITSIDLEGAKNLAGVHAALPLAEGRVFYAGQQVAAVAAVDEKTADRALELIKVNYRILPSVVEWERAREASAPQVRAKGPNVAELNSYSRGDVEQGFKDGDVVLERTYRTGIEIHHPAETHSSTARWDGERLIVYDSTQAVHNVRDGLARVLGMPAANVVVIKNYMGGGFGSKLGLNEHTVVAALLAREAGRPVRIFLSRRDNAVCVGYRPSSYQTYKGAVKKDGTLTALSLRNFACGGIGPGDDVAEPVVDIYKCPNCQVDESSVFTNCVASRAMRAPGHTQGAFGLEGFIEELAAAIDMDPLELRRKNYSTKNRGDTGLPYSTKGLDKCYDRGAEAIGWERRNKKPGEGTGRLRRGMGMATSIWFGAGVPGTLADIVLYPDMCVEVVCGTQDIGCGTRTHMAVVAADTLGLEPKDIVIKLGSSDYPWAPLSGGSLTTPSVAPAVRDAALKALARLKELAARRLKTEAETVEMADGKFFVRGDPGNAVDFSRVYRDLRRESVFHGQRGTHPSSEYAFNTFGAHFAEVEVDTWTGRIRVLRYAAAHDSGRIINTQTARSQVIGAVTQGLSAGLFEERVMDSTTGNPVNANFRDYKVATSLDIPDITPIFIDVVDDRLNNLGTKGLGEPPRIPSSAAIANAVFNAVGVHVREIPMTPDRVLRALKTKEAGS